MNVEYQWVLFRCVEAIGKQQARLDIETIALEGDLLHSCWWSISKNLSIDLGLELTRSVLQIDQVNVTGPLGRSSDYNRAVFVDAERRQRPLTARDDLFFAAISVHAA
jgi:hypothetical protein